MTSFRGKKKLTRNLYFVLPVCTLTIMTTLAINYDEMSTFHEVRAFLRIEIIFTRSGPLYDDYDEGKKERTYSLLS
jgi:hypothetical protein